MLTWRFVAFVAAAVFFGRWWWRGDLDFAGWLVCTVLFGGAVSGGVHFVNP